MCSQILSGTIDWYFRGLREERDCVAVNYLQVFYRKLRFSLKSHRWIHVTESPRIWEEASLLTWKSKASPLGESWIHKLHGGYNSSLSRYNVLRWGLLWELAVHICGSSCFLNWISHSIISFCSQACFRWIHWLEGLRTKHRKDTASDPQVFALLCVSYSDQLLLLS